MPARRVLSVVAILAVAGTILGALAGIATGVALMLAFSIRYGNLEMFTIGIGYFLAALIGAICGALLAPIAAFSRWRHVPLGRLFLSLTAGTILGGSVAALLVPKSLLFIIVCGVLGCIVAGDRLRNRTRDPASDDAKSRPAEPRSPVG